MYRAALIQCFINLVMGVRNDNLPTQLPRRISLCKRKMKDMGVKQPAKVMKLGKDEELETRGGNPDHRSNIAG